MHEIETKHKRSRVHCQNWILKRLTSLIRLQLHSVVFFFSMHCFAFSFSFFFFWKKNSLVFHFLISIFVCCRANFVVTNITIFLFPHRHLPGFDSCVPFLPSSWFSFSFHLFSFQFSGFSFICTLVSYKIVWFVHDISVALNHDFCVAYFACRQWYALSAHVCLILAIEFCRSSKSNPTKFTFFLFRSV